MTTPPQQPPQLPPQQPPQLPPDVEELLRRIEILERITSSRTQATQSASFTDRLGPTFTPPPSLHIPHTTLPNNSNLNKLQNAHTIGAPGGGNNGTNSNRDVVLKELQKRNDVRRRLEVVMRRNDLQTTPNPNVERRQQRTMQRQQQQLNNISNINNINNIYPPRAKSAENFGGIAANFAKFGNPKFNSGGIASDSNSLGLHYRNNAASNVDANSKSVDEGMLLNILQNSNTARSNKSDGDDGNSNKTNLRDMFQRPSEDEQKKKKKRRKKKKKAKGSDDEQQNKPTTHPVTIPMPMASPISSRLSPTSLLWYMKSELFGGDDDTFEDDDDDDFDSENKANERDWRIIDDNISNFMSVPASLEKLMSFGFGVSIDAFLNVIVVVPIQFFLAVTTAFVTLLLPRSSLLRFHRRNLYHLIRGAVIIICCGTLQQIQIGYLYHFIRGQAMIKLYVLIAIMEVFDRLMSSFGQDALDSLYWNTRFRPFHRRVALSVVVVLIYSIVHSLILFVHIATLNVAMNSADQSLLTLLVSGNFAEIKTSVFKKFDRQNLFQLACSDVVERFKLTLFLLLVLLLNVCQDGSSEMFREFAKVAAIVLFGEFLADWVKHSFITKFNRIKSTVYDDYALVLAGDLTGIGHENVNLDHHHAIVKRVGLAQIPLFVVMVRFCLEAAKYSTTYAHLSRFQIALYIFAVFTMLIFSKMLLGLFLSKWSASILSVEVDGEGEGVELQQHPPISAVPSNSSLNNFNSTETDHAVRGIVAGGGGGTSESSDEEERDQAKRLLGKGSPLSRVVREGEKSKSNNSSNTNSPRSLALSPRFTSASIKDLVDTECFCRTDGDENEELVI